MNKIRIKVNNRNEGTEARYFVNVFPFTKAITNSKTQDKYLPISCINPPATKMILKFTNW